MKKAHRSARDLDDRRRLVLARRMVTRTRAGAACPSCKSKKARCSDYRPCARCRDFQLDGCFEQDKYAQSPLIPGALSFIRLHEDGPIETNTAWSSSSSLLAPDTFASQFDSPPLIWPALHPPIASAAVNIFPSPQLSVTSSTGADPHDQVSSLPSLQEV